MSDENKNLVLAEEERVEAGKDLNIALSVGQQMMESLRSLDVTEAKLGGGAYFRHDKETGSSVLAADGIIFENHADTFSLHLRKPGATVEGALGEMNGKVTQHVLGAFSGGRSQQWASHVLRHDDDDQ